MPSAGEILFGSFEFKGIDSISPVDEVFCRYRREYYVQTHKGAGFQFKATTSIVPLQNDTDTSTPYYTENLQYRVIDPYGCSAETKPWIVGEWHAFEFGVGQYHLIVTVNGFAGKEFHYTLHKFNNIICCLSFAQHLIVIPLWISQWGLQI